MAADYHQLQDVVVDAATLAIPRAQALRDAIAKHRDFSLREVRQRAHDGDVTDEVLVVDVQCDGVPSRCPVGINYRERLALCVPDDPKQLVGVLALRTDFPVLMHQNQGIPGAPVSLCLYFESPSAVHRTWTAQSFLRRIQWWLESSAKGELHPADQPVEHLFFQSPYELVLPWNFDALRKEEGVKFALVQRSERKSKDDEGVTLFLEACKPAPDIKISEPVELTVEPVVHGFVERDPCTLGALADMLERRGTKLLPVLIEKVKERVGDAGAPAAEKAESTVILLHVPMRRTEAEPPTSTSRRAFLVTVGGLPLGEATGALTKFNGRYFREAGLPGAPETDAWRSLELHAMSILYANTAAAARAQSGLADGGPRGTLVGAGSLGSAMLNLWSRSGWGEWAVVDKDHIKPHNLSRHVAFAQHVGAAKAEVVAGLNAAVMNGATKVQPLTFDATNLEREEVVDALSEGALIVDASTTLEYPRAASNIDALPRHVSVFITPNGNSAVLLAEDSDRSVRLRTLEAQYYRALIQNDWGARHHAGHMSSYWSGASCRDISLVMPYSRVINHASTLAEQVQGVWNSAVALVRIWQRDPGRGTVESYDVPVASERRERLGAFDVYFDDGLEAQVRDLRRACLPNETGGVLLGYYDFNVHAAFIVAALPAPSDSKGDVSSFERGVSGLKEAVQEVQRRTAGVVGYLGEWHSHPPGHSAMPSRADLIQLAQMSLGMDDDGLPAIQLIVGEADLRILQGAVR